MSIEDRGPIELSIVIPCLNEHETVGVCVEKAVRASRAAGIAAEVIVADNGSTDGSQDIARQAGARIVPVERKGYGAALRGGIAASPGRFVIMGDADDSYDFLEVPRFVEQLRAGHELVMGCRLPGGGGTVAGNAMPLLHRVIGNPLYSAMVRRMFRAPVHDVYCGLRGFTRELFDRLDLRCTGMEFATEMVIKSSLFRAKIAEIPITLHPDGRRTRRPHLRTFRDGWRTLRFFMLYSPAWLFMVPGAALFLLGLVLSVLGLSSASVGGVVFEGHTLLFGSLFVLMGYQSMLFAMMARLFGIWERFLPWDGKFMGLFRWFSLERAIVVSLLLLIGGLALMARAFFVWADAGFGAMDYASSMKLVIPGVTASALGFQSFLSSCFLSILGLHRE